MSKLTATTFGAAHYHATRRTYKYYSSNLLQKLLSNWKEYTNLKPQAAPIDAHSIPAKSATKEQRFYFLEKILLLGI